MMIITQINNSITSTSFQGSKEWADVIYEVLYIKDPYWYTCHIIWTTPYDPPPPQTTLYEGYPKRELLKAMYYSCYYINAHVSLTGTIAHEWSHGNIR